MVAVGSCPSLQDWHHVNMITSPSQMGVWKMASIPLPAPHLTRLEFYVKSLKPSSSSSSGLTDVNAAAPWKQAFDRPPNAESYQLSSPGGYKLHRGRLTPFRLASQPPMMVVSDLDGTMVESNLGNLLWYSCISA